MFLRRTREYLVSCHQLASDGMAATPVNLKHLNKKRKRHTDVSDISFSWISDIMKEIMKDMRMLCHDEEAAIKQKRQKRIC